MRFHPFVFTDKEKGGETGFAARIGGGLDALGHDIGNEEELLGKANMLFKQSLNQVNHRKLDENDLGCIRDGELVKEELVLPIGGIPHRMQAEVMVNHEQIRYAVRSMQDDPNEGKEKDVYFYHSDHLGSASWITAGDGKPVQHLQYLPYGEPYVNQRVGGYNERFTFTGKERDEETGYSYFGARYMDHELMTMWLSVDPMADKYPSISPYAYCAWNPVKLVDPDGREIDISALYDKNGKCKYKFIENALKAFAKTKLGYKELSKYAKAGQDILGVKFDKDGEYHSKGMDLSFGGEVASLQNSGDTERKKVNGRLNITINLSNVTDIKSIFETICHETFIHARQAAADFKDNGELDHSYLNPYLKKYVKEAGGTAGAYINAEHCHFAWYDKSSQHDFIETMKTQYPKASNREIVDIINKGFGRTGIKIKQ